MFANLVPDDGGSIGKRLDEYKGVTTGFDYLRLVLALAVLVIHACNEVTLGENPIWQNSYRAFGAAVIPMFFALSGFLVTASLMRATTLTTFLTHRAVRIIPALAVEIFLSALLLGPIFTTLSLTDYFSHQQFWLYFSNIIGIIHFNLPGVFESLPSAGIVNRSLWTIPAEFYCYFTLALLFAFRIIRLRLLLLIGLTLFIIMKATDPASATKWPADLNTFLVCTFLAGCIGYLYREKLPNSTNLMLICVVVSIILANYANVFWLILPLTYVTIWLGLRNPPRKTFLMRGDYSYGIYLFAYPIQQSIVQLFPNHVVWWFNIALAVPLCIAYAAFSWHCIEKPALARRKGIAQGIETFFDRLFGRFKRQRKADATSSP